VVTVRSQDSNGRALLGQAIADTNWTPLYRMNACDEMTQSLYSPSHVWLISDGASFFEWGGQRGEEIFRGQVYIWLPIVHFHNAGHTPHF